MIVPFSHAHEPIRHALIRLLKKNEWYHPFVIVEKVDDREIFVQFATNAGVLLFDVPLLSIVLEPCSDPSHGAERATLTLGMLDTFENDQVRIIEHDDEGSGRGEPLWSKVLSWLRPKKFA